MVIIVIVFRYSIFMIPFVKNVITHVGVVVIDSVSVDTDNINNYCSYIAKITIIIIIIKMLPELLILQPLLLLLLLLLILVTLIMLWLLLFMFITVDYIISSITGKVVVINSTCTNITAFDARYVSLEVFICTIMNTFVIVMSRTLFSVLLIFKLLSLLLLLI